MTTYNKIIKQFLAPIIAVLLCTAVTGCKDDEGLQGSVVPAGGGNTGFACCFRNAE